MGEATQNVKYIWHYLIGVNWFGEVQPSMIGNNELDTLVMGLEG